uniref:Condensin complex subunit putative n=1 Tax=Albugo laibachii Nc14 TaxID=890382 RepID=F0WHS9_9STRA|nr:condensin complex subunit putative [Albugo laibachii Nc14]|eukprot:CCA20804.1 condensin complex subunit putative [Albugo laibachii Nc14]
MVIEFVIPLHAEDLELERPERYYAENDSTLKERLRNTLTMESTLLSIHSQLRTELDFIQQDQVNESLILLQQDTINLLYGVSKEFDSLSCSLQNQILSYLQIFIKDLVAFWLNAAPQQSHGNEKNTTAKHWTIWDHDLRNSIKFIVYVLYLCLRKRLRLQVTQSTTHKTSNQSTEQVNTKDTSSSVDILREIYATLGESIDPRVFILWRSKSPEEEFLLLYYKCAFIALENQTFCRHAALRQMLLQLVATTFSQASNTRGSFVSLLLESLLAHEHLSSVLADMVSLIHDTCAQSTVVSDLITEISQLSLTSLSANNREAIKKSSKEIQSNSGTGKESTGSKYIAVFLSALARQAPCLIISNLTFLLTLSNSESYSLRNAAVTCLTEILIWDFQRQQNADSIIDGSARCSDDDDDKGTEDGTRRKQKERETFSHREGVSSKTREHLFQVLKERVHDVNAFARCHVIKMWAHLCTLGAIPLTYFETAAQVALDRLEDKTAIVRRNSISFCVTMIQHNPFMSNLKKTHCRSQLEHLQKLVVKERDEFVSKGQEKVDKAIQQLELDVKEAAQNTTERGRSLPNFTDITITDDFDKRMEAFARVSTFYTDTLQFIELLEEHVIPKVARLLKSRVTSDVTGSIQFFEQAYHFQLEGALQGIHQLLHLIWRSDIVVQAQVVKTFQQLFFVSEVPADKKKLWAEAIANNLIQFLDSCTFSEATCLEELLVKAYKKGDIDTLLIRAMWTYATKQDSSIPHRVRVNALCLVKMISSASKGDIAREHPFFNLNELYQSCFKFNILQRLEKSATSNDELQVFRAACTVLQTLQQENRPAQEKNILHQHGSGVCDKLLSRLEAFLSLQELGESHDMLTGIMFSDTKPLLSTWLDAVQQAIDAVFVVSETPERICADVIHQLAKRAFETPNEQSTCSSWILSHFIFVLGHVAIQLAIHVERLSRKIKHKWQSTQSKKEQSTSNPLPHLAHNESTDNLEEELGMAAQVEAEEESFLQEIIRQEIVCKNLLAAYSPLVIRLVRPVISKTIEKESQQSNSRVTLLECAVMTLSKFMAVSDVFCKDNLSLLFTLLQQSSIPSVRGNVIVSIGDLAVRFPNLIEPWTSHVYARLHDLHPMVRKQTMTVVAHLVLNDMIKVKGQMADIAMRIVDLDQGIRDLARLLFVELAKKNTNAIYNMVPDAVGQLSKSVTLSSTERRDILQFIFQFVTKAKHVEGLVEKLSQRFATPIKQSHAFGSEKPQTSTGSPSCAKDDKARKELEELHMKRDLAYCLSLLPHTAKSLRNLYYHHKLYQDVLWDENTRISFQKIVLKVRRLHVIGTSSDNQDQAANTKTGDADEIVQSKGSGTRSGDTLKDIIHQLELLLSKYQDKAKCSEKTALDEATNEAKEPESIESKQTTIRKAQKKRTRTLTRKRRRVVVEDKSD